MLAAMSAFNLVALLALLSWNRSVGGAFGGLKRADVATFVAALGLLVSFVKFMWTYS
jgi:hypothetical protein